MDMVLGFLVILLAAFVFLGAVSMVVLIWRTVNAIMNDNREWQNNYKLCKWVSSGDTSCSIYETSCEQTFYNANDENPVTDWATHCPYCGGKINEQTN